VVDRLTAAGYIAPDGDWTVGENIAWGQAGLSTPRSIMAAWMASPGHRKNILTGEFTEIGLGVVTGTPGDTSWGATYTTDFGALRRDAVATAAAAGTPKAARRAAKRCKAVTVRGRAAKASQGRGRAKRATKTVRANRVASCAGARVARRPAR
jgi:hypothetical protein